MKMAKKQTTEHMIHNALASKIAFGESKHANKRDLGFGESSYKIYSYSTYNTYLKVGKQFAKWLSEERSISKIKDIKEIEPFAREYIQHRLDNGISIYTVKMERSALGMTFGKQIDIEMPKRNNKNITRSRLTTKNDKYISRTGKYKDVFIFAVATGCRRKDLLNIKKDCLVEKDGKLFISIKGSKGGRDRIAYVRNEYVAQVREIVNKAENEKVFSHVPKEIDVHSLRREYAKELYTEIKNNRELRDDILKDYPPLREYRTRKDKGGNKYIVEVKSTTYKTRAGNVFDRADVRCISLMLGHNRIDTSICHYIA